MRKVVRICVLLKADSTIEQHSEHFIEIMKQQETVDEELPSGSVIALDFDAKELSPEFIASTLNTVFGKMYLNSFSVDDCVREVLLDSDYIANFEKVCFEISAIFLK